MGRHTIVGNSPVSEKDIDKAGSRVPPDTRNPVGPRKGSEKESETLCLQAAKAPYECDSVLFVERSGECMLQARLRC